MARRDRPPIQRCLRRGDEIIVQIIKEGIGTKGPTLTHLPVHPRPHPRDDAGHGQDGRQPARSRTRTSAAACGRSSTRSSRPKDVGFIIRTAGVGKTKAEIERDLKYLTRLWENDREEAQARPGADGALHRGRPRHPHRPRRLHHRRRPDRRRQRGGRQARQGGHQDHRRRARRTRSSSTRSRSRCSTSTASSARSS